MQPEQTPDKSKEPTHQHDPRESRRSDAESANLQHPDNAPTRSLEDHLPISLCFHNVSTATLNLLLAEMEPEIAPIVAECLRQTILDGATITHNTLFDSYVDLTPYSISQIRNFRLGRGPAEETTHRIIIERRTDEEPSVFELSLSNTNPRSVDFKIAYSWMDEEERWDNVNAWGSLLGIESISSLFSNTPPELYEHDRFGCCTSLVTGDISIRTEPVSSEQSVVEDVDHATSDGSSSHWIPKAIQISAPSYGDQAAIICAISPDLGRLLVETGLLVTIDAFGGRDADLQTRLLDRASARLSEEVVIELTRLVQLGHANTPDTPDIEQVEDSEEPCDGIDSPLAYGEEEKADEEDLSEEEERVPFSPNPLEDLPVSSSVNIGLFTNSLGLFRLECFSSGQAHGMALIHQAELFNFAVPTFGVRFLDDSPSLRELASRWRLMRQLARIGEVKIDRKDLESNLFFSATSPNGSPISADIGVHRVLMGFNPPNEDRPESYARTEE